MPRLEKIKGKTAYCPTCKELMFCNETIATEKYPSKLQWQTKDGHAHYGFDKEKNEVYCKNKTISDAVKAQEEFSNFEPLGVEPLSDAERDLDALARTIIPKSVEVRKVTELDKKVEAGVEQESYGRALLLCAELRGVEKACKEVGIINGATIGMIFNAVQSEKIQIIRDANII